MNAEQTEQLLRRASALIEVDEELKTALRKMMLNQLKTEDGARVERSFILWKIESLFIKRCHRLRLNAAHWF